MRFKKSLSLQRLAAGVRYARVTVYLSTEQGVLAVQPVKPLFAVDILRELHMCITSRQIRLQ